MSYILDALKRAESERARGLVPGLHAQPLVANRQTPAIRSAAKPALLLLAGVVITLAGVGLWRWLNPGPAPAALVVVQNPAVAARPPAAVAAVAVVPPAATAAAEIAPPPLPAVQAAPAPAVQPAPVATAPLAPSQGMLMAPAQITPETKTSPKPPRPQPPPEPKAQAKAAPAPARVTPLAELPSDARLSIPKVVISGSTYSDTPAYRMLIINGQVFHEGDKIAPDMTLQQIRQGSAVLDYKGQRYSVGY